MSYVYTCNECGNDLTRIGADSEVATWKCPKCGKEYRVALEDERHDQVVEEASTSLKPTLQVALHYCPNCGRQLQPDYLVCPGCGTNLSQLIDSGGLPSPRNELQKRGTCFMLNGTFFWERLISDEGIVSIRVLSAASFWLILLLAEALLFFLFGVLIGFIPVALLFWAYTRGPRGEVKKAAAAGSLDQLHQPRDVIRWDEVNSAKVKKGSLEVVAAKRKQKFEVPKVERDRVRALLSDKLGNRLTVVK